MKAATFDDLTQRILLIDVGRGPDKKGVMRTAMRMLLLDLDTEIAQTVALFPSGLEAATMGIASAGDGIFILVTQRAGSDNWRAQELRLTKHNRIRCLGQLKGEGTVFDVPIHSTNGVFLPVLDDGVQRFTALSPHEFRHDDSDSNCGLCSPDRAEPGDDPLCGER